MKKHLWDVAEATQKIQAWYDDLKVKFNDPAGRNKIKDKYNDDSLVYDRISQKPHTGKRAALNHWKTAFNKFDKIIKVEITIKALVPPGPGVPSRNPMRTGDQKADWDGIIVFVNKKGGKSTYTFSGNGQHIDPCYFGNPDYEDYPW
ncbi:MAG: hypothetical protein PHI34_00805 [Acidobacteriota bacterium]|nr:hypothetical protein [Acidobacteriota bacterium]